MQRFLRRYASDRFAGHGSFVYGSSNHNQRIESFWGFVRKENAQFWMNLFQELKEEDQFTGDFLDKSLIQFCFMKLLQDELNTVAHIWNTHPIRAQRNRTTPHGRPLIMYTLPHLYGVADHLCPSSRDDILNCEEECLTRRNYPCDKTVFELCSLLMVERGLDPPGDIDQATHLYITLKEEIWNLL
ncbi:hypothetical protein HHUSO_G679 [Huso huso]|uniref:Integrase core domain-containing protein n=1 Tax=Huso huso TaxID=61971 RepID=A0ABR1AAP9_HUSHU